MQSIIDSISKEDYFSFIDNLTEIEIEILGTDYTSCWLFAYYIHKKFNLPTLNHECIHEHVQNISEIKLDNNGIYSYIMSNNTEMHYFILFVNSDDVILKSTYGGQKNIITKNYKKNDFIRKLQNLISNSNNLDQKNLEQYCELFGITYFPFTVLDLRNTELSYTYVSV